MDIIKSVAMPFLPTHLPLLATLVCLGLAGSLGAQQNVVESLAASQANIVFPYNPDEDQNGSISINDLLPFLIHFGNPWETNEAYEAGMDIDLDEVVTTLAYALLQQQAKIDSLEGQLAIQLNAMAALAPLINLIPVATQSTYSYANATWRIDGLNVQITNGSGSTHDTANGLGNLLLGYNEASGGHFSSDGTLIPGEDRSGSHNLIVGSGHSYTSSGGVLGGHNNTLRGIGGSALGGQSNLALGEWSSILGGLDNRSTGNHACVSGGHSNMASGDRSSLSGGLLNVSGGVATSILGGQYLQIFEQYETASGQYNINE